MKNLTSYIFPAALAIGGGALLILGLKQGQNTGVLLGAGLAFIAGVVTLLLQAGIVNRKLGLGIGVVFGVLAVWLAFLNYRAVASVLEFTKAKKLNDQKVIQALKDIRTAQIDYRKVHGTYADDIGKLRDFVRNGRIPMVRAIGQIPDTLTEQMAIEKGLVLTRLPEGMTAEEAVRQGYILRDTTMAPALDSLFYTKRALEGRVHPFDPENFGRSPITGKPFILRTGTVQSSGRNVPVFIAKDPTPMVEGDTLMVGSLEKPILAGNWGEE
jgi:hypothetical protein